MLHLIVALALALPTPAPTSGPMLGPIPGSEAPFQDLSFDQALAAAKKDGKVVMIDFFTTWCQPCKRLDRVTWGDAGVQKWIAERTVALKMDAEKEVDLARRFAVDRYPTIAFVKLDGTKLGAIVGFKEPADFLKLANGLLGIAGDPPRSAPPKGETPSELGDDPVKREAHANDLAKSEKYEEALAEYLWVFDHRDLALKGLSLNARRVRLATLLGEIQLLAKKHPPARLELEERRKGLEYSVLDGSDPAAAVPDLASLNRSLGTPDRTLAVYDQLKRLNRGAPDVMQALVGEVAGLLVGARRYDDVVADAGDLEARVRKEIESVRLEQPAAAADPGAAKALERSRAMFASIKAGELAIWYEALLGAGMPEIAGKVADRILEYAPTGSAYASLIDRAVNAQAFDAARALVERGRKALPETERSFVEGAAKKIPAKK